MRRRAAMLACVPVLAAVLVAVPLGAWLGPYQWLCAAVALGLTVTPALATLVLTERLSKSPVGSVAALVLGPVVRLLVGFGGGMVVFYGAGDTFRAGPVSFWAWVLGCYLVTLAVEMAVLSRRQAASGPGL